MARRSARRLSAPPLELVVVARLVAATAAYLAVFLAGAVLLYAAGLVLVPAPAQGIFALVSLGVAEGAALAVVLLFWRLVDGRPLQALGLGTEGAPSRWLRGAAIATAMMGFIVLVWYTLLDGAVWSTNPDAGRAALALLGGLLGFLIQGPAEEVLFRGYIFENVRMVWGLRWAVIVSAIAFAVFHLRNPALGPIPLLNLLLFGVATALYKVRVDNSQLWGVFALHTIWNWLQQVVFGLPNSGIATVQDNALFTIAPNTALPEPIWGGGFGPEGTLGATLVLLALIVGLLRTRKKTYEVALTSS